MALVNVQKMLFFWPCSSFTVRSKRIKYLQLYSLSGVRQTCAIMYMFATFLPIATRSYNVGLILLVSEVGFVVEYM